MVVTSTGQEFDWGYVVYVMEKEFAKSYKDILQMPMFEIFMLFEHFQYQKELEKYYRECEMLCRLS